MKLKYGWILFFIVIISCFTTINAVSQDKVPNRLIANWKCFEIQNENCDDPQFNGIESCENAGYIFYPDGTTLMYWNDKESVKGTYKVKGNSIVINGDKSQNLTFIIEEDTFSIIAP